MNNLEIVREACVKASPAILALEFGCRIKCRVGKSKTVFENEFYVGEPIFALQEGERPYFRNHLAMRIPKESIVEIIGRPIRLADVLVAISDPRLIITSHRGEFRWEGVESAYWDLKNDDLEKQSPECIDFLTSLLNPPKH